MIHQKSFLYADLQLKIFQLLLLSMLKIAVLLYIFVKTWSLFKKKKQHLFEIAIFGSNVKV